MELDDARVKFLLLYYPRLEERAFMLDICSALGRHPVQDAVTLRNGHWNFSDHDQKSWRNRCKTQRKTRQDT